MLPSSRKAAALVWGFAAPLAAAGCCQGTSPSSHLAGGASGRRSFKTSLPVSRDTCVSPPPWPRSGPALRASSRTETSYTAKKTISMDQPRRLRFVGGGGTTRHDAIYLGDHELPQPRRPRLLGRQPGLVVHEDEHLLTERGEVEERPRDVGLNVPARTTWELILRLHPCTDRRHLGNQIEQEITQSAGLSRGRYLAKAPCVLASNCQEEN